MQEPVIEAVLAALCLNAEAARLGEVAGETIRHWRRAGRLRAWRVGSVWLYERAEVLRLARAHAAGRGNDASRRMRTDGP
jgi:hypothetical protein